MFESMTKRLTGLQSDALGDTTANRDTRIRIIVEAEKMKRKLEQIEHQFDRKIWQLGDSLSENRL